MISCPVVFLKLAPRSSLESPLAADNTAGEGGCLAPAAVVTDWRALVHRIDLARLSEELSGLEGFGISKRRRHSGRGAWLARAKG